MYANVFPVLPLEVRQKHKNEVQAEIEKRWKKLLEKKPSFAPYKKKSDQDILKEFQELHHFRLNLWYRNPGQSPHICQEDYQAAQDLLEKGYYRMVNNIAFAYNRTDTTYNASTVLIEGYHFIAMQEPNENILNLFFKFLINHQIDILVRVKADQEFSKEHSVRYWKGRLEKNAKGTSLNVMLAEERQLEPIYIPYFYTDEWIDNDGLDIKELYRLVQEVREAYQSSNKERPIACHCASGVGRTGAFIAAFVLAEMIDQSKGKVPSIEEVVLKLSIQRPNLMGTAEQYLLLYRFVEYYLSNKGSRIN
jgi:protein-tyrosine phosphatase